MSLIQFVKNYEDLSTDRGYQFEFHCDRCGNGYLSGFQASVVGTAGSLLRAAGSLLGGVFSSAGHGAYEIQQAVGGPAHDSALRAAVEEVKPRFKQCRSCAKWVCNEVCWNPKRGLCTDCAPKTEVTIAAAQAEAQLEQIREKVRLRDQTADLNLDEEAVVMCSKCGSETGGGRFCGECGAPVSRKTFCTGCGSPMEPGAKFCPSCGAKR